MVLDVLSNLLTEVAKKVGYNENLKVIKSNRLDLCDYQCDEVFKLAKLYHQKPSIIGENIVNALNNLENFDNYWYVKEYGIKW